jgi:TRAP-type C4-dicarboxylate transport system substrate-binding protein
VSVKHLAELTAKTRVQNNEAIAEIKKEGVQMVAVDPAARKEFTDRGRAAWGDGVGTLYSQELLDRVKKLLSDYRSTHSSR